MFRPQHSAEGQQGLQRLRYRDGGPVWERDMVLLASVRRKVTSQSHHFYKHAYTRDRVRSSRILFWLLLHEAKINELTIWLWMDTNS